MLESKALALADRTKAKALDSKLYLLCKVSLHCELRLNLAKFVKVLSINRKSLFSDNSMHNNGA